MQNRYVGDIGDYIKYGLLRELAKGMRLGVAWYLFPDEVHNDDGKHTSYLKGQHTWGRYDNELFLGLSILVKNGERHTKGVESASLLPHATYANEVLEYHAQNYLARQQWRKEWFERVTKKLRACDMVFADPDNGLCEDDKYKYSGAKKMWKRMPLSEAAALANGRQAIIYHHHSRSTTHKKQIQIWRERFSPRRSLAVYCRAGTGRTFLIINPTASTRERCSSFVKKWDAICKQGRRYIEMIE